MCDLCKIIGIEGNEVDEGLIEELCEKIDNNNINDLIKRMLRFYLRKRQKNKIRYFCTRILSIILGGLIVIFNVYSKEYNHMFYAVTITSAINTMLLGFEALFDRKDTWNNVSKTYEAIKMETIKYVYGLEKYGEPTNKEE